MDLKKKTTWKNLAKKIKLFKTFLWFEGSFYNVFAQRKVQISFSIFSRCFHLFTCTLLTVFVVAPPFVVLLQSDAKTVRNTNTRHPHPAYAFTARPHAVKEKYGDISIEVLSSA